MYHEFESMYSALSHSIHHEYCCIRDVCWPAQTTASLTSAYRKRDQHALAVAETKETVGFVRPPQPEELRRGGFSEHARRVFRKVAPPPTKIFFAGLRPAPRWGSASDPAGAPSQTPQFAKGVVSLQNYGMPTTVAKAG